MLVGVKHGKWRQREKLLHKDTKAEIQQSRGREKDKQSKIREAVGWKLDLSDLS